MNRDHKGRFQCLQWPKSILRDFTWFSVLFFFVVFFSLFFFFFWGGRQVEGATSRLHSAVRSVIFHTVCFPLIDRGHVMESARASRWSSLFVSIDSRAFFSFSRETYLSISCFYRGTRQHLEGHEFDASETCVKHVEQKANRVCNIYIFFNINNNKKRS